MIRRTIAVSSPAKVNLFLGVGERGDDGYHELETILQCLDFCDILTFELHDEGSKRGLISLTCTPSLEIPQENNLAYRATAAFVETFGCDPLPDGSGISIRIEKNIPSQAGFGGGSSNAAAALLACAKVWGIDPLGEECLRLARSLGADVPFFLYGGCAYMVGRGDILRGRIEPLD
ncbi:MAG: 4-diphosphocytidyl-2C-methyl-D-erythritol kinase, partial [Actinobacteria bacterium]|nr:4-diphosphocytidyl-2C-methyl-D-erythritol kinase [Actinomycetota bacterium]